MKFLGTLFVFAGYIFLYASVAAGGKFATEPWAGLFADAYTGAQISGNTSGSISATGATTSSAIQSVGAVGEQAATTAESQAQTSAGGVGARILQSLQGF